MSDVDHKVTKFIKKRMKINKISQKTLSDRTGIKLHSLRRILGNKRPLLLEEKFILFEGVGVSQEEVLANVICDGHVFLLKIPEHFTAYDFDVLKYLLDKLQIPIITQDQSWSRAA